LPIILGLIATFILPFSFTAIALLFIMLAIFAISQMLKEPERFTSFELSFLSKIKTSPEAGSIKVKHYGKFPTIIVMLLIISVVSLPVYFAVRSIISDFFFQKSLIAASNNQGLETYNMQIAAIQAFPYRDVYYRGFSQTNLALANSLAVSQKNTQKNSSPSAEVQQNILQLIQQSINAGRTATAVAPLTSFNWNNLSTIYRSLIGFGQNADQFTILTNQQAIALDPSNPQQYIELGGVYYQLGAYDEAIRYFQQAIALKKDYANAYYNLGHTFEAKGDLQTALTLYQTVQQLVAKDETNNKKISEEIKALQIKIGTSQKQAERASNVETNTEAENGKPLEVNKAETQLPERDPRVSIPAPTVSQTSTKTKTKTNASPTTFPTR